MYIFLFPVSSFLACVVDWDNSPKRELRWEAGCGLLNVGLGLHLHVQVVGELLKALRGFAVKCGFNRLNDTPETGVLFPSRGRRLQPRCQDVAHILLLKIRRNSEARPSRDNARQFL